MRKLTALLLVVSSLAFAQTEPPKTQPKAKTQVIDFVNGSEIGGEVDVPTIEMYTIPDKPKFSNLIKVRTSFSDKLMASVHEL